MASKNNTEYTVRDYSAVDAQVLQIAERERVRTQKMKIANLGSLVILGLYIAGALAILILISGIAYRIAFPPDVEIVERTEIIEKVIEPQQIIIQTPVGSEAVNNSTENSSTSKFLGNDDLSINDNLSSNENNEIDKDRVIGSRSVTTFTSIQSNLKGFGPVVTGWEWSNIDADKPSNEYCYIDKYDGNDTLNYSVANKISGKIIKSKSTEFNSSGLSNFQVSELADKCRWFSN